MNRTKTASKGSPFFADSMLFLAVLGWAVSFPIAKLAMNDWGGYRNFFLAGRFWMAFVFFAALTLKMRSWKRVKAHAKPGFWVGITLALAFNFQYAAMRFGTSGEVAFITALSSVMVPIGTWMFFKKKVKVGMWVGLAVATIGAVLVEYKNSFSFDYAGWLALLGAAGIAAYLIMMDRILRKEVEGKPKYEKVPLLTVQFLVLATSTTLLSLFTEVGLSGLPPWSINAVLGMVFMAVVATAGAFFIKAKYLPETTVERAALVFTLESPFAGLFGYLLLGEAFTLMMMTGAALIFSGVAFAEYLAARDSRLLEQSTEKGQIPPSKPPTGLTGAPRTPSPVVNALPVVSGTPQPCHGVAE